MTTYINEVVAKAHQRANMIHRCFVSQSVELLTRAFMTYVRPMLEYNSVVWSPSLKRWCNLGIILHLFDCLNDEEFPVICSSFAGQEMMNDKFTSS